ncbi:DHA2 family efflux MFS transporter permease subunit [Dietzia maris]|uniref:DHA2 family efflux MFS transporter permease subunit n=1 Tax=Mycobacteriales TaxID=85007 RepID=UPI000BDE850A|nr:MULTISPECIES: DHA2 family efflux MFS transporter permease subunit [Mycobacteriales]MBB0990684.1 DHA2 family efflux MFS transporter permease subunit [Dietzia sp. SLG510A3-30A2]MBB0993840.1 DHA2 family efflux MFS transporter permease subunit [Dietzia sp. SLG510A3-40A3]MBB1009560.1 DHA2 family efflux MFS transporter permease subunit [Dietzia sp. SLG510A3-3B2-2]HBD21891.1 MFS transporter [Dietzia sp.]MBB0998146.1 DHA2 family efflux MFS transporter permease subunit [Dietzia maris]
MTTVPERDAWKALAALVIGFFMILVDQTIVAVATDAFVTQLGATTNQVIWVTSAYLLAYVVPLLFTGRLGDQIGPRRVSISGLVLFTGASLWCGLAPDIETLIVARVFQGFGAALLTPQSLSVITRVFAPARRGAAMGAWGAVAGIASVVGPVFGGVLIDAFDWRWIFFVNIPFGVLAVVLVWLWVPVLETRSRSYDVAGIVLSAVGMFLLVFGIQQGEEHGWGGTTAGFIAAGVVGLAVFVWWQSRVRTEPLVPLRLFRDRNFSIGTFGVSTIGFVTAGTMVPLMFYLQGVKELSPTRAGMMLLPMALIAGVLAPLVGRWADRLDPRIFTGIGYFSYAVSLFWLALVMDAQTSIPVLLGPIALMGVANGCVWAPTSSTAMRRLELASAGAGSGVYNTTRQVGAVLGSAAIGAVVQARFVAHGDIGQAVADAMFLPAVVVLLGGLATMAFRTGEQSVSPGR